jgi:hypothetical protein
MIYTQGVFALYEHFGVTGDRQVVSREAPKWHADSFFSPDSTAADEKA